MSSINTQTKSLVQKVTEAAAAHNIPFVDLSKKSDTQVHRYQNNTLPVVFFDKKKRMQGGCNVSVIYRDPENGANIVGNTELFNTSHSVEFITNCISYPKCNYPSCEVKFVPNAIFCGKCGLHFCDPCFRKMPLRCAVCGGFPGKTEFEFLATDPRFANINVVFM
ncbi:hypothetical protein HDV00_009682 [Rhizophlyctis rosea]|nr:hypothetical protein HDV00_009682 [Rhizophlyctis rosea]